ncbi:MAG: A/G-specific adenine glycosylase [Gemmatimonadota bacterium]|nr:A/G-specific adenine glycosylase [Gemmatimonadota bacterium]
MTKSRTRTAEPANRIDPAVFRRRLLDHFDRCRRDLPWRRDRTPYSVVVSEFMLQQTRVETVIPYYRRWLTRFPDWRSLAGASDNEVLLEWKGLGYYGRARNLHRSAKMVCGRFGGRLPDDPRQLRSLPGVGEYTAGAVASIAFGQTVPAVDGNVRRVLSRLLDVGDPTPARLRDEAARLIDPDRPGDFNEALMELGATVCTPRSPRCDACPVEEECGALAAGTVAERPSRSVRRRVRRVEYAVAVVVAEAPCPSDAAASHGGGGGDGGGHGDGGTGTPGYPRTLLVKRPPTGLLAGMWEFPALAALPDLGLTGTPGPRLDPVTHAFTHLRATYRPVIVRVAPAAPPPADHAWAHPDHLDEWALPVAQQKIGALLREWLRGNRRRASG